MKYIYILLFAIILYLPAISQEHKNLTLNAAIEMAMKNNLQLKILDSEINAEKGKTKSSLAIPKTQIGFENQWIPSSDESKSSEKTFSISQSFEFPTNYFLKGDLGTKNELLVSSRYNSYKQTLISKVKKAFYKVLVKNALISNAKENFKISEDFFKKAEIRQNVGEGTELEKLTAKVQMNQSKISIDIYQNELTTAITELKFLLGCTNEKCEFEFVDTLSYTEVNPEFKDLYNYIESNNPEIKAAQIKTEIANIEKNLAWSTLLPDLSFSYYNQSREGGNYYGYSAGINLPIWFMFEQTGKVQTAESNIEISNTEMQFIKSGLFLNLQSEITEFENNKKQVKQYKDEIIPQTEEIFQTADKSYSAGDITYLEYLNAKQTYITSQNNYFYILFEYYNSIFDIEEIVGKSLSNQ